MKRWILNGSKMVGLLVLFSSLLSSACVSRRIDSNHESPYPQVAIRDTERRTLASALLGETLEIDCFLPKYYYQGAKSYPVVYVLDAEYNFGMVAYAARRLIKNREIPEVILVGIAYNTTYDEYSNKRQRDYTPWKDQQRQPSGGAGLFIQALRDEVFPFIEASYRVSDDRTLIGHSYGGLLAAYLLVSKPELFRNYLIVSPSLWYHKGEILKGLSRHPNQKGRVYTAVGAFENNLAPYQMIDTWRSFSEWLTQFKANRSNTMAEILEQETHRSVFPHAFTRGLRFIFNPSYYRENKVVRVP